MVPYRSNRPLRGLGFLGASAIVGTVATKGASLAAGAGTSALIGTAAGTTGGALFGAAAGSVVPIIGTVIGAVVGILTSKLFGHANYAAVYSNIANVAQLFQAYEGVAGQYPGRMYGWPELQYIWHGAMVSGLFPGNGPPAGQPCTQAMISNKINACGTGQWIDDLLGSSKPTSPGSNNIAALIAKGLSQGISDPITMTNNVLVPGMEAIAGGRNNGWISVARSANPQLYRQLLMDTADYMMSTVNPSMPAYYGPAGIQQQASPAPTVTTPSVPVQQIAPAQPAAPVVVSMPPVQPQIVQPVQVVPVSAAPQVPQPVLGPTGATTTTTATLTTAAGAQPIPVDATAQYLATLQAQGASQNQAMLQAIAALQSQGYSAQAAQSTVAAAAPSAYIPPQMVQSVAPQAAPVTAGLSGNSSLLIAGALAVLGVIFATARTPKGFKPRRQR